MTILTVTIDHSVPGWVWSVFRILGLAGVLVLVYIYGYGRGADDMLNHLAPVEAAAPVYKV